MEGAGCDCPTSDWPANARATAARPSRRKCLKRSSTVSTRGTGIIKEKSGGRDDLPPPSDERPVMSG